MRICVIFYKKDGITLPLHYNHIIQSFIYKSLDKGLAKRLHDKGFLYEKRRFKLFVFSRLIADAKIENGLIHFKEGVKLYISSPIHPFIESLAETLLKMPNLQLHDQEVFVESIHVCRKPSFPEHAFVKMLSPLTIYSTLKKADGAKKTYYYNPWEDEFSTLIKENLIKKYKAFYEKEPDDKIFSIRAYKVSKKEEKIINYKAHG
jgi:CRISPR-associated endoribonuclease Cas6